MVILLVSAVICAVLILASMALIIKRQPKRQQKELMRLSETVFTAVMGFMMIALGVFLLYQKYTDPEIAGTDINSYVFICGFSIVCVACGSCMMPYTFLKKIIACEDRVIYVTILGECRELYWRDVTEVKLPLMSSKITLIGKNTRFVAGGETKAYKEFIRIAKNKIRAQVGSDVLDKLSDRLMI